MKSKVYTTSFAKRILLTSALVVFTLSAVSQTQAKASEVNLAKATVAVVTFDGRLGSRISNSSELKARLLQLLPPNVRLNLKTVKVISKNCGCTAVQDDGFYGFGSCMKGCLQDVGVSPAQVITCGASCAAAGTGLGAIVCAICVGVDTTVVVVCAMGCAAYPGPFPVVDAVRNSAHATPVSLQAKLRLHPAKGKS